MVRVCSWASSIAAVSVWQKDLLVTRLLFEEQNTAIE